jgi:hypothetical protein
LQPDIRREGDGRAITCGNTPPKFINYHCGGASYIVSRMKVTRDAARRLRRIRVLSGLFALFVIALAEFWMVWRFGCDCVRAGNTQPFEQDEAAGVFSTAAKGWTSQSLFATR